MDFRTAILALVLFVSLLIFGIGLFRVSFGDEPHSPAVDMRQATQIVLEQFPHARILEMELDTDDGRLVYEVELITAEGQKKEIHINATTGRIEKIEYD
ncbi:PepSY domain-containing protein [Nitrospira defluvii]|uniref:PepSY domain-containing protein n=1 Tax=Nitrospira defluvii TaxID=330214 RepID=A0ABM8RTN1_9BACT|nr:PepSY domain-containing protein [Nitrospira defluvii]CAE6770779.1 PepSY domain-containing protein [Nitrospira defluvii]